MSVSVSRATAAWTELLRSAIVGTQRSAPSIAHIDDNAFDALLSTGTGAVAETDLLRAGAVLGLAHRAGAFPADLAQEAIEPAAPEGLPRCSSDAARDLLRLLEPDGERAILAEWLALARTRQVRVPEQLVPRLLALGTSRRELHRAIVAVTGSVGAWLARQEPEWSYASGADDPERVWHEGEREARIAALGRLRERDPAVGRELLREAWEGEPPADRAALLAPLAIGLTQDDEPLLEAALDDRRKEVRSAAATLLARLPGSRLASRAIARIGALASVVASSGGPSLIVALPPACDAAMQRDGIELRPPGGIGERAFWLQQLVARVPPSSWTTTYALAAQTVLALAAQSDQAEPMLAGLVAAAGSYGDEAWCIAIAGSGIETAARTLNPPPRVASSPGYAAAVAAALDAAAPAADVLARTVPAPWDAALSRAFLDFVRRSARSAPSGTSASPYDVRALLALGATRVSTEGFDPAEGWQEIADELPVLRAATEQFVETVRFRASMRDHLRAER